MSFLSWFSKKARAKEASTAPASDILQVDLTLPLADAIAAKPPPVSDATSRKSERHGRRELLYAVVRDSMNAAGLLSSSYKFKVLTLDSGGRKFLIMMDLPATLFAQLATSADMEMAIARRAKDRHDLLVSAVYWRLLEPAVQSRPLPAETPAASPSRPAPASAAGLTATAPQAASSPPASSATSLPTSSAHSPLTAPAHATPGDAVEHSPQAQALEAEMRAFKQARAAGLASPLSGAEAEAGGQSASEPGDFEDTIAFAHEPPLGPTQYGDLREG